jgi:lipoic acid synthetase
MKTTQTRKPDWLKVRFPAGPKFARINGYHREQGLHSVCRSAACPNQGDCWSRGTATFMILGNQCTRDCRFCNVQHAEPAEPDVAEVDKIAKAVAELELAHAVITAVTRDDLVDGGASMFAAVVMAIRKRRPQCRIELLVPDLRGDQRALETILNARPDVLGHNMETVPRLYSMVRPGAEYRRSLTLLSNSKKGSPHIPTKSGLMLGMGETFDEVLAVMDDLRSVDCTMLTLGQYLQPTRKHWPVDRYVPPDEFDRLKEAGRQRGFKHVESGPLVRSSFHAAEQFEESAHD